MNSDDAAQEPQPEPEPGAEQDAKRQPERLTPDELQTRQRLRDRWNWLSERSHMASQDLDKAILTLAAGGLGVSLVLLGTIPSPRLVWVLGVSWGLFVLSLLLMLVSLWTSRIALRREIDHVVDQLETHTYGPNTVNPATGWTRRLTVGAGTCLILGIIVLATFALSNLNEGTTRNGETIQEPEAAQTEPPPAQAPAAGDS